MKMPFLLCFILFIVACSGGVGGKLEDNQVIDVFELQIDETFYDEGFSLEKQEIYVEIGCTGAGCPCVSDSDCDTNRCIKTLKGNICATLCTTKDDCPKGLYCSKSPSNPDKGVCMEPYRLCQPCMADGDCTIAGSTENHCVSYGLDGSYCGVDCGEDKPCPDGFECKEVQTQSGSTKQCVVEGGGMCPCTQDFITKGFQTYCYVKNEFGQCQGKRTCDKPCPAPTPKPEECNGIDDNCDGETDEMDAKGCKNYYYDKDQDGFGDGSIPPVCLCHPIPNLHITALDGKDCDDNNSQINPSAEEHCDGMDNDCDSLTDEPGAKGCTKWYLDQDGDGYGENNSLKCLCNQDPSLNVNKGGDCDDLDKGVYPGAVEICNGKDDDCDGLVDNNIPETQCTIENAFGVCPGKMVCESGGLVCKGQTPAKEVCNTKDDDCDGLVDPEGSDGCSYYYIDKDNDGYGTDDTKKCLCQPSAPYLASQSKDCNDLDNTINPASKEVCDGKDNDCDGLVDPPNTSGCSNFYEDKDGDGWGVNGSVLCLCKPNYPHTALADGDCDDEDKEVHPKATEKCDGKDNDCDGIGDVEGTTGCKQYYKDADGDGYGPTGGDSKCLCGPSLGYVTLLTGDCDDNDKLRYPAPHAICGKDADCDLKLVDFGEECDDGNDMMWDGCNQCNLSEFQVNSYTTGDQHMPRVTTFPDGRFWIVWAGAGKGGSGLDIYLKRYNAQGYAESEDERVNTYITGDQGWKTGVTPLLDGGAVIVWHSFGQDGSDYGIYGQLYDKNGKKQGQEFQINTTTTGAQAEPAITTLSDGRFVVVWHSMNQDGSGTAVIGRVYSANGLPLSSENQVNTWTTLAQANPSITKLMGGGFVVIWESQGQDTSGFGIFGQVYKDAWIKEGGEFQVNTTIKGNQTAPSVAYLTGGGFVVAWHSSDQDGSGTGIFGQIFDPSGKKVGGEFQINTYTNGNQSWPSVAPLPLNGFLVVWHSADQDGSDAGVFGQRYKEGGTKTMTEFQINTYTNSFQGNANCNTFENGKFIVVWRSLGQDGSQYGVFAQRFDVDGKKIWH